MYSSYYGFAVKPFEINTDPRFLWLGEKHAEALSMLRYGVLENRGFLLLTGDVGTGKTTLLNALLEDLDPNVQVARIPDPRLELMDFLNILAHSLHMKETFQSRGAFLRRFEAFISRQHYQGRKVLLLIDEAQRLTPELLEEIRALSNLDKPHAKLLNVFFVGQNEFNDMLLEPGCRALRQRITLSYHLEPLNRSEVGEYIWHRQKTAGADKNLFSKRAVDTIYNFSEGFPRVINVLCDHALLTAYTRDGKSITGRIVSECAKDLEISAYTGKSAQKTGAAPENGSRRPARKNGKSRRKIPVLAAAGILLLLICLGYGAYLWIPGAGAFLRSFAGGKASEKQIMEAQKASSVLPAHERANPPPMPQPTAPGNKAPAAPARERPYKSAPEDTDLSVLGAKDSSTGIRDSASPVSGGRTEAPKEKIDANHAPKTPAAEAAEPVTSRAKEQGPSEKPPPASPPAAQEKLVVYFLHNASGLDRRSMETLELAAGLLQNNPRLNVQVIGYTDSLGDPRYNLRLSKRRADIVGSYLRRKGVDPGRIHSIGLGSSNPMMPNRTQEGRAQNRRVEILFDSGYE